GNASNVHVAIRRTGPDDLAPGLALSNGTVHHDQLSARDADAVDVFHFSVFEQSDATLGLHGAVSADLLLFSNAGTQLACACDGRKTAEIVRRLSPGTYLAAVRGRPGETGPYGLSLRLREPTSTLIRLTKAEGDTQLKLVASVEPATAGRLVLELERFDPLSL